MLGDGDIAILDGKEHFTSRGRYFARFKQLFTIARVRRATLAAFVVMIAQQMCGSTSHSVPAQSKISNRFRQSTSWPFTPQRCSCKQMPAKELRCLRHGDLGSSTSCKPHSLVQSPTLC